MTSGSTKSWQPASNWGWGAQTTAETGAADYYITYLTCVQTVSGFRYNRQYEVYGWTGYTDPGGTLHPVTPFATSAGEPSCDTPPPVILTGSGTATDGSGYQLLVTGVTSSTVTGPNGMVAQNPGFVPSSIADSNGNYISSAETYTSPYPITYTDTLGTAALKITNVSSTQTTYAYTAPSGATANYTFNYTTGNTVTTSIASQ